MRVAPVSMPLLRVSFCNSASASQLSSCRRSAIAVFGVSTFQRPRLVTDALILVVLTDDSTFGRVRNSKLAISP